MISSTRKVKSRLCKFYEFTRFGSFVSDINNTRRHSLSIYTASLNTNAETQILDKSYSLSLFIVDKNDKHEIFSKYHLEREREKVN